MTAMHSNSSAETPEAAGRFAADDDEGDLLLRVAGIVPAADFHPFVVKAARRLGLKGWVRHDSAGALIRAIGPELALVRLVRAIRNDAPPSARVRSLDPEVITPETPAVGERFMALVAEPVDWPTPSPTTPRLAHVA